MTSPEARLRELGITLPEPPKPVAAYIPAKRVGNLLYTAGQVPIVEGKTIAAGRVPDQVPVDVAIQCARRCVLNGLAVARAELGSLDKIVQVVRVGVFVASEAGFHDQPRVANGASELLVEIFGEAGKHARTAVGSVALPLGVPVEVEFVFECRE